MNIHGYKIKIKELKQDLAKKRISMGEYNKRRNRYSYDIKKLKEQRNKQKKK